MKRLKWFIWKRKAGLRILFLNRIRIENKVRKNNEVL